MKRFKPILFASLAVVVVVGLHVSGVTRKPEGELLKALASVSGWSYAAKGTVSQALTQDQSESQRDKKFNELLVENAKCQLLRSENESLKKMLSFRETRHTTIIPARIIGAALDLEKNILLVDKGTDDGVEAGSAVIVDDGIMIGKIHTADTHTSQLMLLNDNRSKVIATFVNEKLSKGTVEGQFQLGLKMNLIPITEHLEKGMSIVTSGTETKIPAGLLIGSLDEIQSRPTDLFQQATVLPLVSYDRVRVVSIVKMGE